MNTSCSVTCCTHLDDLAHDEEYPVIYVPKFREYGIQILDGGTSYLQLKYCPICGRELAGSLRRRWFDLLDELGLEPGDDRIPHEMESDEWWIDELAQDQGKATR